MVQKKDIDWGSLGFAYMHTDYSYVSNYKDGAWDEGGLTPTTPSRSPSAQGFSTTARRSSRASRPTRPRNGDIVCFRPGSER
jgi:branched-chain amino acid aminotransferase